MARVVGKGKQNTRIPKKFAKAKKSFVKRISDDIHDGGSTTAFCAFPQGINFSGQDREEAVVLLVRKHPAVFIPQYLGIIGFLIAPLFVMTALNSLGVSILFGLGVSLFFILLAISTGVDTFVKWFYSINIVTDERIVDVDFSNILYHRMSEAQLEKVEDVSHMPAGILSALFDFGDVYIQTAGSRPEFDFNSVPKPREIQDTILDLLEMKQKGQI